MLKINIQTKLLKLLSSYYNPQEVSWKIKEKGRQKVHIAVNLKVRIKGVCDKYYGGKGNKCI